jgi:cobalt-zinc-cadmium efflux system outer membrane protein
MFHAGEVDRLALLSAQLELVSAALSRLGALLAVQQAQGLLEDALQRPLEPDEPYPVALGVNPRIEERGDQR